MLAFLIPHTILDIFVISPFLYSLQDKIQKAAGELADLYTSFINMADIVQLYDYSHFLSRKMPDKNKEIQGLNIKRTVLNAVFQSNLPLFGLSGYLATVLFCGDYVSKGLITISVMMYALQLRGSLLPAVYMILQNIINIKVNLVSIKRINEI